MQVRILSASQNFKNKRNEKIYIENRTENIPFPNPRGARFGNEKKRDSHISQDIRHSDKNDLQNNIR